MVEIVGSALAHSGLRQCKAGAVSVGEAPPG